jgi:SAM-dependent methyltransferase
MPLLQLKGVKLYRNIVIGNKRYVGEKDKRRRGTDYVLEMLPDVSGQTVLDVGCAGGAMCFAVAEKAEFVQGVDVNEDRIKAALQIAKKHKIKNVSFVCDSVWNLPSDKYDGVLLLNILHHEKDPGFLLDRMTRCADWVCIEHPVKGYFSTNGAEHPADRTVVYGFGDIVRFMDNVGWRCVRRAKSRAPHAKGARCIGLFARV